MIPSFGIIHKAEELYVTADELRQGDEVIDPTPKQLASMRVTHPEDTKKFYGHLLSGSDPLPSIGDVPASLLNMEWKDAVIAIRQTDDVDRLAIWYEQEMERDPAPRPSVMKALEEAGIS